MALLTRPLFGEYAQGTLARVLAYRNRSFLPNCAKIPRRGQAATSLQSMQRARWQDAARAWHALSDEERSTWDTNKPANLTGFNFFMRLALMSDLFYLGYCVFGQAGFQLVPSPNQPSAADYYALFPGSIDTFPTMVDGAHSFQSWIAIRMYNALETIEAYFIAHREALEE